MHLYLYASVCLRTSIILCIYAIQLRVITYFQTFVCVIKGAQIGPSLKNLAEQHTDIFGSEETMIGIKVHAY